MPITNKQIALIHVAKKQLDLTEEDYRSVLKQLGQVDTSKDLDQIGFEAVMQYMIALGFKSDFSKGFYGHRPGRASPAQVGLIRKLWDEYTAGDGDERSLDKWLSRTFKISALRFVTADQARKAITALKAMKKRHGRNVETTDS